LLIFLSKGIKSLADYVPLLINNLKIDNQYRVSLVRKEKDRVVLTINLKKNEVPSTTFYENKYCNFFFYIFSCI